MLKIKFLRQMWADEDSRNLILAILVLVAIIGGYILYLSWDQLLTGVDSQRVKDFLNIKTYD